MMVMDAETVSRLFPPVVFARGEAYARDGRVHRVTRIAPDLLHGEVEGGTLYDVSIRIADRASDDDGGIRSMSCSCPFAAKGRRCKHEAAVLLAFDDVGNDDAASSLWNRGIRKVAEAIQDGPGPMLTDVYDEILPRLASWYGAHGPLLVWDEAVVRDCAELPGGDDGTRRTLFPVLSEQQAGRMTESFVQAFLESRYGLYGRRRDDPEHDAAAAFIGADSVLDNALAAADYAAAMRNAAVALSVVQDALDYIEDCGSGFEDHYERLVWKMRILAEKAAGDERADLPTYRSMSDDIARSVLDDRCGFARVLGSALLSFSRRPRCRSVADAALTGLMGDLDESVDVGRRPYLRACLRRLRHDDLLLAGEYDRAKTFASDNVDDTAMAEIAVTGHLLNGDHDRAWDAARRYAARRRARGPRPDRSRGRFRGRPYPRIRRFRAVGPI
ncbi:hypothetical protein JS533_011610 [Bifidobacterium amazonense]|uniref:SWIM-type domain-containing protein n=1 Tax=Bifidobacterium amazonense TaxID=2809027 RepID=A0ABS9VY98_9BIFI|nr:hypothetical protein [Bifidobacterium amazonense]MCH9276906.1 hypothetical protein [Bifidobacterium amazonense]